MSNYVHTKAVAKRVIDCCASAIKPSLRLTAGHRIRAVARPGKLWRAIGIPRKLLRPDGPRGPTRGRVAHAVIHDPALAPVRAGREAGVADADGLGQLVLVEDAAVVLGPVLGVHGVLTDELELAEAVVRVVGARGRVDDEGLARRRVRELLGPFIRGQAYVEGAAVAERGVSVDVAMTKALVRLTASFPTAAWAQK